nr:hypothetical protein [Tanacetum cinerariifolium]
MTWFKEVKIHLETLYNNRFTMSRHKRPYEIASRILFKEEYETFRKIYHNLNQIQWQLERENLHSYDPKTCLDVLRTWFKEFFDSKEVNDLDFHNKCWQKDLKIYTRCEPETYRRNLQHYLDVLDKLINERVLKYGKLHMKDRVVQAIQEIAKWLKEREIQQQVILITEGATLKANLSIDGTTLDASSVTEGTTLEACLVTEGTTLEACLVTKGITMDDNLVAMQSTIDSSTLSEQHNECNSSRNECSTSGNENTCSDNERSGSGNDADVDIGPSYDSVTVSEVNREAQQANALLTKELERYKEKEKHFAKEKTIESEILQND